MIAVVVGVLGFAAAVNIARSVLPSIQRVDEDNSELASWQHTIITLALFIASGGLARALAL